MAFSRDRMMRARVWRFGLPVAAATCVAMAACSFLVPLNDQQCNVNADCTARGGDFAGSVCTNHVCVVSTQPGRDSGPPPVVDSGVDSSDAGVSDAGPDADPWFCLGQPHATGTASQTVQVTLKMFDALTPITTEGQNGGSDFVVDSYTPVPGVNVEPCDPLDPTCANPIGALQATDDAGIVSFPIPGNFQGFFQFTKDQYLPSKLYMGRLQADASTFQPPAAILSINETKLIATTLGVTMATDPDAGVGHAFVQVYDCYDRHAAGVSYTFDVTAGGDIVQWYYVSGFPSKTGTATDALGAGGMVNIPAGALTITATLVDSNRTLGTVNSVISAGGSTFAWIRARTL